MLDAFEWQAAENGDRTAHTVVVDGEREEVSLTFAELARRARAIAAKLQALGRVGDRVLVLCPSGPEYIGAMVGCLYSGLVAVPAYAPDIPGQSNWLIDMQQLPGLGNVRWVAADRTLDTGAWTKPQIDAQSLALILYTSGSTSRPKGVMLSHENLVYPSRALRRLLGDAEQQLVVVAIAPHVADSVFGGLIYPLFAGLAVTFISPEAVAERPARWLETISRTRATTTFAANFLLDLSVRSIPPEARSALDLSRLTYLRNSGESVRADTIARFEAYFAPCGLRPGTVRPAYGLSEARGVAAALPGAPLAVCSFDRESLQSGKAVALPRDAAAGRVLVGQGPPTQGQRLEIIDPQTLTRSEPGRAGEIWTSGPHVAQGYWNQAEETAAAFDAHLADTGEGPFFRTGDLGFLHEGELFITGRLKETIIIRGRNLYPSDVEASLHNCHSALASHAAAAFSIDVEGWERLVIVHEVDPALGAEDQEAIIGAIRQRVSARHGVQAHTVVVAPAGAVPRIGPGKIDRAECRARLMADTLPMLRWDALDLTSPRRNTLDARAARTRPRTPTERTIAQIWERVLEVNGIGVHDAFAELGGDSLLGLQVVLGIKQAGLAVTPDDISRYSTVSALAAAIDTGLRRRESPSERRPLVGSVPLTNNQRWLLESDPAWAVGATLLIQRASTGRPRALDAMLMERAAQYLVFHHDALRLRCVKAAGRWKAMYSGHTPTGLVSFCDLSPLPAPEQPAHIVQEIDRLREAVALQRGPLFRLDLIKLGAAGDMVVVCVHHVISDLLSTDILIRDLETVYSQLARGIPPQLPARTATIKEWVQHARAYARSAAADQQAAYWSRVVAHKPSRIRPDFPKHHRSAGREHTVSLSLGREQTSELKTVRQLGLGVSDAVHYALARALSEQASRPAGVERSRSVRFHSLTHARGALFADLDFSRTVGFLAAPFPVLLKLSGAASHLEGVRAVREQMQAIPHHGMSYQILLDCGDAAVRARLAGPGADPPIWLNYLGDRDRLFGRLDTFRHATEWTSALPGNDRDDPPIPWTGRIEVTASIEEGDLLLRIAYHDQAYHAATIQRLASRMLEILTQLVRQARR
jgi:non-ribosomal peptide synthase protein (TIGR01720 family)